MQKIFPIDLADAVWHRMSCVSAPTPSRAQMVQVIDPEFSSVCPVTGLPDYGRVIIQYVPDALLAELKDLKLYLRSYYGVGIMHESATHKIATDFIDIIKPRQLMITIDWGARGGLKTVTRMVYEHGQFHYMEDFRDDVMVKAAKHWTNE